MDKVEPILQTATTAVVDPNFQAWIENTRLMNEISREMREIPELPSEKPTDVAPIRRVEFPPAGGVLTYMEGHDQPYLGFPLAVFVDTIDLLKKVSRGLVSALYHSFKRTPRVYFLTLIPAFWLGRHLVHAIIYIFYRQMERFRIKPLRYCTAVRELYRAFTVPKDRERLRDLELRLMLRDVVCMLLEFDNAYRFRAQDILVGLDKEQLQKRPIKEFLRLVDIMQTREVTQEIRDTWTLFKLFIRIYFRIDRAVLKIIQDAFMQLDMEKIKLSVEDQHYCEKRTDYKFGTLCQQQNFISTKDTLPSLDTATSQA